MSKFLPGGSLMNRSVYVQLDPVVRNAIRAFQRWKPGAFAGFSERAWSALRAALLGMTVIRAKQDETCEKWLLESASAPPPGAFERAAKLAMLDIAPLFGHPWSAAPSNQPDIPHADLCERCAALVPEAYLRAEAAA